ncbi:MAG: PIN domain-containing protein [Deltaproteobacteria bacterium]|nr:PIN domain-containing protein [Deltaproteobacteria bacterium]
MPILTRLLDSVILIDHLNGVQEAKQFILALEPEQTAISVITRAEILVGVEPGDAPMVKALLDQFHLLIIDKPIADLAADMRKNQGWKLPDAFQAALCIYHKIKLVTRNTKDFDPVRHDFVEIPYELRRD